MRTFLTWFGLVSVVCVTAALLQTTSDSRRSSSSGQQLDDVGAAHAAIKFAMEEVGVDRGVLRYRGRLLQRENQLHPDTIGMERDAARQLSQIADMEFVEDIDKIVQCPDAPQSPPPPLRRACVFVGEHPSFEVWKPRVFERDAVITVGIIRPSEGDNKRAVFEDIVVELYFRDDGTWQVRSSRHVTH